MARRKGLASLNDVLVIARAFQIVGIGLASRWIPIGKAAEKEVGTRAAVFVLD